MKFGIFEPSTGILWTHKVAILPAPDCPLCPAKTEFPKSHLINILSTKLVGSIWLGINFVFFMHLVSLDLTTYQISSITGTVNPWWSLAVSVIRLPKPIEKVCSVKMAAYNYHIGFFFLPHEREKIALGQYLATLISRFLPCWYSR